MTAPSGWVAEVIAANGAPPIGSAEYLRRKYGSVIPTSSARKRFRLEPSQLPGADIVFLVDSKTEEWGVFVVSDDGGAVAPLLPDPD